MFGLCNDLNGIYNGLFTPCTLPPDLTKSRLVNELCNLLKGSHIMWKKLKTLSCPAGFTLNAQSWQLRAWQTPHVLGCTLCSPPWHLGVSSLLHSSQSDTGVSHQCGTGALAHANSHGVLTCGAVPTRLVELVPGHCHCSYAMCQLHTPPSCSGPAFSKVNTQLCAEYIHSLTCCSVVSDIIEAEFLRSA